MNRFFAALSVGCVVVVIGCGKKQAAEQDPPEVAWATTVYQEITSLREAYQSEGVGGLQSSLTGAIENMENYEKQAVGDHQDTYRKIFEGLQELKKLADSAASAASINKKLKELLELADKLPAKKDEGKTSAEPKDPDNP